MATPDLGSFVGKNINAICGNGFHKASDNHCAHFASHVLELDFSVNCKQLVSGSKKPAGNVRVHEMFAQCSKVGKWSDADLSRTQLIFVTRAANVNLQNKTMVNIPKKHVGIFHEGKVYHYGNTLDKVTTDTPETFRKKFDKTYGDGQGYFFGWIPGENLLLDVQRSGQTASAGKKFDLIGPEDGKWFARELSDGKRFLVGREVNQPRKKYHGICVPVAEYWGPTFSAAEYADDLDHWAHLLEVTGHCESKNHFVLVNTYDRAKFTFGFYQLAAHTPRDNLILLFRALSELPDFQEYFPELRMIDGRLARVSKDGSVTDLEVEMDTGPGGEFNLQLFMNFLNPRRVPIDEQEILNAARLIHWTVNDPAARLTQVQVSAVLLQSKLPRYSRKLDLDGKPDTICALLCDILHQGRGTFAQLRPLLAQPDPEAALLSFKDAEWGQRNKDLRDAIKRSKEAGGLGTRRYSAAANEFV